MTLPHLEDTDLKPATQHAWFPGKVNANATLDEGEQVDSLCPGSFPSLISWVMLVHVLLYRGEC